MNSRRSVFGILLLLCFYIVAVPGFVRGQASLQRGVRISNANGNIITILSGLTPSTYTLLLPSATNPSTTSASLLFGIGNAALDWTATAGVTSGNILTLQLNGSNLVPTWLDPATILNGAFWTLTGNSITSGYNGTTGNFIGTTNTEPLVIATTNTATAQDIRMMTGNSERLRINGSGEVGIGVTATVARLLHVAGTSGVANVRFNSLSGANLATTLATNEGLVISDANGDLTKRSPSILGGSFVLYDVTTTQNISTVRSDNLFNVSYSGSGNDVNAAGAVITSVGGATNRSATALTLTATGTGSGTTTGLNVTASGGSNNYAATFTGSVGIGQTSPTQALELRNGNLLLSNSGTTDQLQFQGTSTGVTTFQAGAQGATNINYILPIAAPSVSGQVLSSTTAGAMSWTNPGSGTVTSVGLALPVSVFTVSGSPVTTSGTLTGAFATQTANTVFAGPSSGIPAVPTFRTLTPSDVNAWGLTGNSGLTAWNGATGNFLGTTDATDVVFGTGATAATREKVRITTAGNLQLSQPGTQLSFLGTSTGVTTFQAGAQGATNINYTLPIAAPTVSGQVLSSTTAGAMSWSTPSLATVTSVGLALPVSVFTVSGSPVTTSGTLTGAFATQTANTVFAGPSSGVPAVPTFRTLTPSDVNAWGLTGNSGLTAWNGATGNFLGTTDATDVVFGTGATALTREKVRITTAGNLQLSQPGTQLSFLGTSTGVTTFQAGAQGATNINYVLPIAAPSVNGQVLSSTTAGTMSWSTPSSGTVTSVGLALPVSVFTVSGSPVTTSGTLTGAFATQTANTVFAGPSSGVPAVPTFRTLTPSDVNAWGLTGNSGLTAWNGATGNFLGTTDATDVVIGTGAVAASREKLRITNAGNLQLATSGAQLSFKGTAAGVTTFQAGVQGATNINYTLPIAAPTINGQVLSSTTAGAMSWTSASSGTVTSVGLALPVSVFTVSGSPVTTTGTLTGAFATQTANTVFAGPSSGVPAVPTFRTLTPSDVNAWGLTGNSGLTAWNGTTGNFLGTTDATDVVIGTGATALTREKVRITTAGNLQLSQPGTKLSFLGTSTGVTTFQAGAQGATNLNYTLPIAAPTVSGQVLSSTTAGILSWASGGSGTVTGSGTATRIAFWGPGPGVTSNLQDNANLYWDNTNSRISIGAGTTPTATLHALTSGAKIVATTGGLFNNTSTSATNAINKISLDIQSSGSWGSGVASTSNNIGLNVNVVGATNTANNIAALFNGGDVGIGNTQPAVSLDVTNDFATREYNYTTSLAGTVNNINFDGLSNQMAMVRIQSASAPILITGIVGGANGKHLTVYNGSNQSMTIVNQSASSTAANRIITGTIANIPVPSTGSANFIYSAQEQRWVCYAVSGVSGWLYTGNSGLTDNVSNYLGTLDDVPIRFVSGATSAPNTRMLLDINGNLLFGAGAGTSSFAAGSGRFAFGDALTTARLNSVPTFGARVFNMIDANAVLRVWRFNSNAGGTDPAVEFVGGTNDDQGNALNSWWDIHVTGTPGVPNSGTVPTGEHMNFRRRTGTSDSEYVSIFSGGNVGIGDDGNKGVPLADVRLNVTHTNGATATVTSLLALNHRSTGTPAAGFGSGMLFRGESTTTNDQNMASINSIWTTATHASRSAALTFSTVDNGGSLTEAVRIIGNNYVGINATDPAVSADINGGYATRSSAIALSNGTNNNIATGNTSFARITGPTAAFTISGIAGGSNGKRLTILNTTGNDMTLAYASALSTAGNRIETNANADITFKGTQPIVNLIYDATGTQWLVESSNASQTIGPVGSIQYDVKAADQTVTNSAALTNDNDIAFTINANETWEISGVLDVRCTNTTPNYKCAFTIPTGAIMKIMYNSVSDGTATNDNGGQLTASGVAKNISVAANVPTIISFTGIVRAASSAGTIQFKWAQNASNANGTTVKADSYMKAIRMQ